MQKRKKFVVYLRTPKGDRRLEQVATSPREALQEAFGTLPEHLPTDLPDDARCRLECDGQVLGFCPDELGVLNGALHADDDVLDPRPGRTTKTASASPQDGRYDFWKTLMNDLMRDVTRRVLQKSLGDVVENIINTRPVSPGHVHQTPNVQQPLPDWPAHVRPGTYAAGGIVKIDDQTYKITGVDGDVVTDSTVPPPAPSAPSSGSTTDAPERTPEP